MVVLAGDMNGHVGSNSVGYSAICGGFGYGDMQIDPGSQSFQMG